MQQVHHGFVSASSEFIHRDITCVADGVRATMIARADGRPMRNFTNGRQNHVVGEYYSQKNGRSLPWESRVELRSYYHSEVRADVISYQAQPHTLRMLRNGVTRIYTPDRLDKLSCGRIEVIEVKDIHKADRDPDYARKLSQAEAVYAALGCTFRLIERHEIEADPQFKSVEQIQSYRRTVVTMEDALLVSARFSGVDHLPLKEVAALFCRPILGMAKVYAMAVRRIVEIDLSVPLGDATPIRLISF